MRKLGGLQRPQKQVVAQGVALPAPVGGWDAISPLANMPIDRAVQIDNWVCRPGWIEPRKGSVVHATGVGSATTPVQTLMAYNSFSSGSNKLFAAAGSTIYDVTNIGAATPTTVTSLSSSRLQYIMFSNAADLQYLVTCNGIDGPWLYNGSAWSQPSITVASGSNTFDPTEFIGVNAYQGRLWYVQQNSTDPVYMTTVGAVSGSAFAFPLGQLLNKGGYLMAIGRWTVDTRQNVDEYIAFISSRGEVVVYAGTDPSTASTFQLVGIYQIGAPIGRRCFLRISGDLQIITVDGVVGMSEMLSTDRAAANRVSLTSIIMNAMASAAQQYRNNFGWQLIEYAAGTLAILNIPIQENSNQMQFVMNTITGAWSRFIGLNPASGQPNPGFGINANTWEVDASDNIYWAGNNGTVYQWNIGGGDGAVPITCLVKGAYNNFGNAAQLKCYKMLQPLITTSGNPLPSIGINVDFQDTNILSTEEPIVSAQSLWGQVDWGQFDWASSATVTNNWLSVSGIGHYVSIVTQITTVPNPNNPASAVTVQLNGWNMTSEAGAFV
jgi:hypothetical protein